jgi:mannose-6-phosphate isomerase-like protein (cupin superfamily)
MNDPREGQSTVQSTRPWGDIHMVVRNQKCSVDLTEVKPGERASLHSHAIRHELFHFLDDGGILEIDGDLFHPKTHEEFLIKPGQKHRFWAEDTIFQDVGSQLWRMESRRPNSAMRTTTAAREKRSHFRCQSHA